MQALVLGGHGDQMVSVVSATTVGGVPMSKLVGADRIDELVERTAKGGGEVVNLLGTSAWYAPGAASAQMVNAIMLDEKRVLPCTAYLEGEYGIDGLYMGVPVKLGADGVEEIVELELTEEEQTMLNESADAVREVVGVLTLVAMDLGLKGRTALVCGASSGLGLATAESLAAEGANVTMFARRRDMLEREADRIGALAVRGDVKNPRDLSAAVDQTVAAFDGLDILVWNGGGPPPGTAADMNAAALEEAVELLLVPPVRLVHLCLPHLERSPAGRILFFTSIAVKEPAAHLALTNALRPGLTGWAKALARDLGPRGITVNCVAPGRIDTDRLAQLYPEGPTDSELAEIPVGRWGTPQEFGDVACFLASDRARYVTGTTVLVDGGLSRGLL